VGIESANSNEGSLLKIKDPVLIQKLKAHRG